MKNQIIDCALFFETHPAFNQYSIAKELRINRVTKASKYNTHSFALMKQYIEQHCLNIANTIARVSFDEGLLAIMIDGHTYLVDNEKTRKNSTWHKAVVDFLKKDTIKMRALYIEIMGGVGYNEVFSHVTRGYRCFTPVLLFRTLKTIIEKYGFDVNKLLE